jgi:NAD(P)-dependent dehydrogenase (short-subunit alcohol dehydrogenase family)
MITARREDGLRDAARQVDGAEWFVANAGRAAPFLVGEEASWITGHCLTVDGGELVIGGA